MKVKNYFVFLILFMFLLTSCNSKSDIPYNKQNGYEEYISDSDTGYEDLPYFNCMESMEENEKAYDYYKNNKRRCDEYIITDYEDGVCINRYVGWRLGEDSLLEIPEELDGKPVVKIGGYPIDDSYTRGAFAGNRDFTIKIPSTVKIISNKTFLFYSGIMPNDAQDNFTLVKKVEVSEDNPYYSSYDGALYTKDKKKLLFEPNFYLRYFSGSYTVPDFVETFEPCNGVSEDLESLTIGKNVKYINAFFDKGENGSSGIPNTTVRGYKGTIAEEWAEEQYAKFEAIG